MIDSKMHRDSAVYDSGSMQQRDIIVIKKNFWARIKVLKCSLRCTCVNATTEMADGDTAQKTPVIKDAPITYKSDVWANFGFY